MSVDRFLMINNNLVRENIKAHAGVRGPSPNWDLRGSPHLRRGTIASWDDVTPHGTARGSIARLLHPRNRVN